MQLYQRGLAVPSYPCLNGKFVLELAITNHRCMRLDFDFLVEKVLELARAEVRAHS